ncbi:hypothetical protein IQ25_03998 [Novosphingobium taihuense]|uniref:TetR family transcriptional regulator n=1 Tax=Novosphingobium taihuense TaxID=260085 RepID=A0A7W7AEX0_9SPHN|nr:hypothetical protein [Novosphingobium taihuense]TWH79277.1 hypothetical protein IQ25_03998 [Novosphingobium taihuense]
MFDEVVAQPFNRLMQDFITQRPTTADLEAHEHHIFTSVYKLIEQNQALFAALLSSKAGSSEDGTVPSFDGLLSFFRLGTEEQLQKYRSRGETPPFDIGVGLRLAFGMLASSVLLRDWLFPDGAPTGEAIVNMLEHLVKRALDPA